MSLVLASIVSTERNANLLTILKQLRDPFMVAEMVGPGCLFTKFFCVTGARKNRQNIFFLAKKL